MRFDDLEADGFEQVVLCHDAPSGLRAAIAIHSTALGPALGGCRFRQYPDPDAALADVMRLAKGMTYKAALAGLDLGGGKAVIIGDPRRERSEALLRAFGRHVDSLGGRYITAEDVGTTTADMDLIRRETRWVTGVSEDLGGAGDPSPVTASGVMNAIETAAAIRWGSTDLAGRHVVVQGVGKVGYALATLLHKAGCRLTVADVDVDSVARAVAELGAATYPCESVLGVPCDVFAPCALGGVLDDAAARTIETEIVCGSANNQLADPEVAEILANRGITYVPDFVANAGGLIHVAAELNGHGREHALVGVEAIGRSVRDVLHRVAATGVTTDEAATATATERIEAVAGLERIRRPLP